MKRFIITCCAMLTLLSVRGQSGIQSKQAAQGHSRLVGYTRQGWGRSSHSPFSMRYEVIDSFALSYHGAHGSYYDGRRQQYLPADDRGLMYYYSQAFFTDLPQSNNTLPPLSNGFFFSWASMEYDSLLHFHRDSVDLPLKRFAMIKKQYGNGGAGKVIAGQYLPDAGNTRIFANNCTMSYNAAGQLSKLDVNNLMYGQWRTEPTQIFFYNAAGQLIKDSSVENGNPRRAFYGYTASGLVDTITRWVFYQGIWMSEGRNIFTYDYDAGDNNGRLVAYLEPDTYEEQYSYAPGTGKISGIKIYQNQFSNVLKLTNVEDWHLNAAQLPDTIFYPAVSGYWLNGAKVFRYDSLNNPVSVTLYSNNVTYPTGWGKGFEERFYYELMPASVTGVSALQPGVGFSIYPNPTIGAFTVSVPSEGTLDLYNMQGARVAQYTVGKAANNLLMPAALLPGMYLVRFIAEDGTRTQTQRLVYQP